MKPRDNIERFVADTKIGTSDKKDRQVLGEILRAHEDREHRPSQKPQPHIWRIIMNGNTRKLAAAAGVILTAALLITMSDWMTRPAWALAQTIEALKNIKAIYIAGRVHSPGRQIDAEIEIWATSHSEDPAVSGDFRYREGDFHVCVASEQENLTYVSDQYSTPNVTVVYITEGLNRRGPIFPSGDMLEEFKRVAENWREEYRADPATGRSCVYVTFAGPAINTARYWQVQIDLQTKLPVRAAVWFDEQRQGKPHYEYTNVQYNPQIPEGHFTFSIPAGAHVVDCRILRRRVESMPGAGISVAGLSYEEACKKVAQAYWQAVIARDWGTAQNLRPLATGPAWDELAALYAANPPAELVAIPRMNHLQDPGTFVEVFCVVRLKDGATRHSLLNVDLRETAGGRIGVVAGTVGPEFYEAD